MFFKKLSFSDARQGALSAINGNRLNPVQLKLGIYSFLNSVTEPIVNVVKRISLLQKLSGLVGRIRRRGFKIPRKKIGLGFLVILLVVGIGLGIKRFVRLGSKSTSNQDQRIEVLGAKAAIVLNKEFEFPLRDQKGKEVSKIKFNFENAEKRDEIIVKGQRATAVKGRTFLILTLKITNAHNQAIEIDTKDYVRLTVNNNENEKLAPDIHNDPVQVQADSTKFTRVGFPINDIDKDLALYIGEIQGEKQKVELKF